MCELEISCLNCKHFESFRDAYDDDQLEPWDLGWCHHPIKSKEDPTAGLYYVCDFLDLIKEMENIAELLKRDQPREFDWGYASKEFKEQLDKAFEDMFKVMGIKE